VKFRGNLEFYTESQEIFLRGQSVVLSIESEDVSSKVTRAAGFLN